MASAVDLLPLLLLLGKSVVLVLGHERDVGFDDGAGAGFAERQVLLETTGETAELQTTNNSAENRGKNKVGELLFN